MQTIILAAGKSSRFYPFNTSHKSSIRLLGKTIIEHTIISVKKAGITDIIIVVSDDNTIKNELKDGSHLGVHITYVIQDEALGAGDALLKAKQYITGDFFVTWASRIEFYEFAKVLENAKQEETDGVVLIKETDNIAGVGVVSVQEDRLQDIIEKPDITIASSNLKIVGIYLLPKDFFAILEKTPQEHYNFEKALVTYAKQYTIRTVETKEETLSLKYPWDILQIKDYLLDQMPSYRGKDIEIAESAVITGNVHIGDRVKVMEHATITGPCYIGDGTYIGTNAIVRNKSVLEENVVVGANMEVKNSVLFKQTTTHSGFIGDSIIGQQCKIAALFCTANVRLDRQPVSVVVDGKEINSYVKSLGVFMGDNGKTGIRVSTMPGKVIGRNVTIGAQTTVLHNIADNMNYYTKFSEVVEKKKE